MKASQKAQGDWPNLLSAAGLDQAHLSRKHGPCPCCGGKDRYRFVDRGEGLWVCSQCTEAKYASGLELLRRILGFREIVEAAKWVHEHYDQGTTSANRVYVAPSAAASGQSEEEKAKRIAKIKKLWDEARPVTLGDPVDLYLKQRVPGLQSAPEGVRYHPAVPYWDATGNEPVLMGKYPAMLALGLDAKGQVVQIHKTYLTGEGRKADVPNVKKTDVGVGANSFALRIMPAADSETLGVAEGIETAIAASKRQGIPVWACHSASVLQRFEVPQGWDNLKKVVIFADNDEAKRRHDGTMRKAGLDAATALAKRLREQGVRSMIVSPGRVGADMADIA